MTTAHENLKSIQSRIDELEQTISERGEQIRTRARHLKDEIQEELAPEELVRKHPFKTTGAALLAGLVIGSSTRSIFSPPRRVAVTESLPAVHQGRTAIGAAIGAIGAEVLHAGKDLAISWIRNYIEEKKKPA
ncbi:MAG: hypothetical protein HGB02_04480 [Chlorobiaceae bacterium]|nr:hypothetical protein [Chlorobiaceae bacterium]